MSRIIIYIVVVLIFSACSSSNIYDKSEVIDDGKWKADHILRFEYIAEDTLQPAKVYINMRHTGLYKYNNIYFFITTVAPNGKSLRDTAEFIIAETDGKWKGSGIGDIYDVRMLYQKNVRFAQNGKYIFYVQQAMRDNPLENVTDVGLRIDKE